MNKEKLVAAGIDYDQGVNRFAGRAAIYEKYLRKALELPQLDALGEQLAHQEWDAAFRTAHELKGMSGNLSMNAFYAAICQVVEAVRSGAPTVDTKPLYNHAKELYLEAAEAIREA